MAGGCPGLDYSQEPANLGDDIRLKIVPLVGVQLLWGREAEKELVGEFTRHRGGLLVCDRIRLGPSGKVVGHYKDVGIASR